MSAAPKQKVYSALEVAKICGVVNQTVINWIRAGHLKASTTPGGQFRVYPDDLKAFLQQKGMKIPADLALLVRKSAQSLLVVEDDRALNDLLAAQMRRAYPSAKVLQAFDGFEAGSLLGGHRPQAVFLDLNLPGVDGYELCRRIKQDPGFDKPLVIAITSSPESELEGQIRALGADAFFRKPLDFERLIATCRELISPEVHGA